MTLQDGRKGDSEVNGISVDVESSAIRCAYFLAISINQDMVNYLKDFVANANAEKVVDVAVWYNDQKIEMTLADFVSKLGFDV